MTCLLLKKLRYMTSAMTSPDTSKELFLPNAMANLKDLNDGGELTSVITCRVPAEMKGDAIKAAAKEKLTLSQWMALLVERALDPKTSVLVGRDELSAAVKRAQVAEEEVKKLNTKYADAITANQGWSKHSETTKKKAQELETAAQAAQRKVKELEERLKAANAHIKEFITLGKPKQF
jgi:hypothetical protein